MFIDPDWFARTDQERETWQFADAPLKSSVTIGDLGLNKQNTGQTKFEEFLDMTFLTYRN